MRSSCTRFSLETDVPTLANLVEAADGLFEIVTLQNDRDDYRRTCRSLAKLLARSQSREAESRLVGSEIVARYLRYLKLSASLFHLRVYLSSPPESAHPVWTNRAAIVDGSTVRITSVSFRYDGQRQGA